MFLILNFTPYLKKSTQLPPLAIRVSGWFQKSDVITSSIIIIIIIKQENNEWRIVKD